MMNNLVPICLFLTLLCACGGPQTPPETVITTPAETDESGLEYVVEFRGRDIDLEPYVQGFPYGSLSFDLEQNLLVYMEDREEGDQLRMLDIPHDGAVDLTTGAAVTAVDWSTRSWWGGTYHPNTESLVILSDEANEERMNLYTIALDDESVMPLTDNDYTYGATISEDNTTLGYIARHGLDEPFNACLHIRDITTSLDGEDTEILCDQGSEESRFTWSGVYFGPSNDWAIVLTQHNLDRNQAGLARIDFGSPEPAFDFLLEPGMVRYGVHVLKRTVDDQGFLYTSAEEGFDNLYRYDFAARTSTKLTDFHDEMASARWIEDERTQASALLVVLSRPHESEIVIIDPDDGGILYTEVVDVLLSVSDVDGAEGVWQMASTVSPLDVERFTVDLNTSPPTISRHYLTGVPDELAEQILHCDVERIEYPTFDALEDGSPRMLHAYYLTPHNPPVTAERMVRVTSFYGGGNYFSKSSQIMCEAGIATLSPSPRGSWGFGAEFSALNDRDLGGDEIIDIFYAARWLQETHGYLPHQIGVYGGSHGGFATMRAMTFPPETNGRGESFDFGFGLSHAGFSNIISFYETCNIPDWVILEAGDPEAEADKLLDRSPISHTERLRAPILLTHGENDNRVPVDESRQFAQAAAEHGDFVTYVEFSGQGHGIDGLDNTLRYYRVVFEFLEGITSGE